MGLGESEVLDVAVGVAQTDGEGVHRRLLPDAGYVPRCVDAALEAVDLGVAAVVEVGHGIRGVCGGAVEHQIECGRLGGVFEPAVEVDVVARAPDGVDPYGFVVPAADVGGAFELSACGFEPSSDLYVGVAVVDLGAVGQQQALSGDNGGVCRCPVGCQGHFGRVVDGAEGE